MSLEVQCIRNGLFWKYLPGHCIYTPFHSILLCTVLQAVGKEKMLFIFDMGGVVSGNVQTIPAMANKLGISIEDFFRNCGVPDGTPRESMYDFGILSDIQAGRIGSATFWKRFRNNADNFIPDPHEGSRHIPKVIRDENLWETCFQPELMPLTVEIIKTLKKNGHRVVCGTNTLDAHYAVHKKNGDYTVFDAVYASHLMGVIKPHREFWERILKKENAKPEDAIFIDDNEPNVIAAQETGIRALLFTSGEKLANELTEYLGTSSSTRGN